MRSTALQILAPTPTSAPDSVATWGFTGGATTVLLAVVLGFLKGWIVPGWIHRQEVTKREALEVESQEQVLFFRDQVMPLLTRTQDVLSKTLEERAWDERAQRKRRES